ncbi:uncharacterized protein [Epargyreus clarus]|uniref:uncharacterized protein n=1 Tax=Epargyreus clarus TaxID=520877 RepID=UPI003C2EC015
MNSFVGILAFVVILLVGVNGRHVDNNDYEDVPESEHSELLNRMRDSVTQMRHRRRSRQMFPYDYQPPFYYSDNRRDYNHQQEEYLSRILKSLDEIISNLKRTPPPPPPPQPIYIPYPVVHYQSSCGAPPAQVTNKPDPLPPINDTNIPTIGPNIGVGVENEQIWGAVIPKETGEDDFEGDGSRPISFTPVEPSRPIRPAPPVDHGTLQAGSERTTRAPVSKPSRCEVAILSCCSETNATERKNCFTSFSCTATFSTKRACEPSVIKRVLEHYKQAYGPNVNA